MAKFDPDGSGKSTPRARRSEGATRSRQTHDAILAAALEILEERGYAGFTVEAVASRARAGKPTIYKWWKSKGALLVEITEPRRRRRLRGGVGGRMEWRCMLLSRTEIARKSAVVSEGGA